MASESAAILWEGTVLYRTFRLIEDGPSHVLEELNGYDAMSGPRWIIPAPLDPPVVAALMKAQRS